MWRVREKETALRFLSGPPSQPRVPPRHEKQDRDRTTRARRRVRHPEREAPASCHSTPSVGAFTGAGRQHRNGGRRHAGGDMQEVRRKKDTGVLRNGSADAPTEKTRRRNQNSERKTEMPAREITHRAL